MEQVKDINLKSIAKYTYALATDKNNNLWIGSGDGLAKYDGKEYTYYNKKTDKVGLPSVFVNTICASGDEIFVGTNDGLSVLSGETWKFYDKKAGLENKRVPTIAANSKGQVFIFSQAVLSATTVLNIYENGELKSEKMPQKSGGITKMVTDADDNLWMVGPQTLTCRKANGEYVYYNENKDFPVKGDLEITDIAVYDGKVHLSVGHQFNTATQPESDPFKKDLNGRVYTFGYFQTFILPVK
jgi:ligand-binding sensor domain-containing protein